MVTVYFVSLLGVAGATTAIQYRTYRKSHPKGAKEKCGCKL